jgi:hypothetical protein
MKCKGSFTSARTRSRVRTNGMLFVFMASILWVSPVFSQSAVNGAQLFTAATAQSGQGCPAPALPNVNQLALLRWYGANTVTNVVTGGGPRRHRL